MDQPDTLISNFLLTAHSFADEARTIIRNFPRSNLSVRSKVDKSLVTEADIEIERILRQRISQIFPDHGVIGEEFPPSNPSSPYQWVLDPIDGTEEFVHGLPTYGCIISLEHRSSPVIGIIDHPSLDIRLSASINDGTYCNDSKVTLSDNNPAPDVMRLGISKRSNFTRYGDEGFIFDMIVQRHPNLRVFDSCFAYSCAATGGIDVMVDYNVRLWDISACRLLCEEAGGAFAWIKQQQTPNGFTAYSAVYGKKGPVKQIVDRFFTASSSVKTQ